MFAFDAVSGAVRGCQHHSHELLSGREIARPVGFNCHFDDRRNDIAVQRGNADIMIQAAQRARGKRWSRQRRHRPVARRIPHSRSRGREGNLDVVEGERRQRDSRALACVARLIGLSYSATACLEPSCNDADSEAETELAEDDAPSAVSSRRRLAVPPKDSITSRKLALRMVVPRNVQRSA